MTTASAPAATKEPRASVIKPARIKRARADRGWWMSRWEEERFPLLNIKPEPCWTYGLLSTRQAGGGQLYWADRTFQPWQSDLRGNDKIIWFTKPCSFIKHVSQ